MIGEELQKKHADKITNEEILCLEVAGLCHDLGHGPFSHVFDQQFQAKCKDIKKWTVLNLLLCFLRTFAVELNQLDVPGVQLISQQ
uniref:HD domain-containing protein n=1 Tax=Magallana gigas TaxID=29159 RepID=A0A8W8JIA3_MAGGI